MKPVAYALMVLTMLATGAAVSGAVPNGLARFGMTLVLSFVAILFHEAGHALAARAVGARVLRLVAFPMAIDFRTRRIRFVWKLKGAEVGGFVSYELNVIDARRKRVAIAAAGPLANLVLTVLCAIATLPLVGGATRAILCAFAILSAGVGISNLLPFEGSDGARIVRGLFSATGESRPR